VEPVLATAAVGAVISAVIGLFWRNAVVLERERMDVLRSVAAACRLDRVREWSFPGGFNRHLTGASGDIKVELAAYEREKIAGTILTLKWPRVQGGLELRPENVATSLERWRGGKEIEIGDRFFDESFWVTGVPTAVRAALDFDTRRLLVGLSARASVTLTSGTFRADVRGIPSEARAPLAEMLQVAQRLAQPLDVPSALARNVQHDKHPEVRLQNLLSLLREFPEHPSTAHALGTAATDADPEVRLRAAMTMGNQRNEILLQLARDSKVDDGCAARAIHALGRNLSAESALTHLQWARKAERTATTQACIQALGLHRAEEAVDVLRNVMHTDDVPAAVHAAQALGRIATLQAQRVLLDVLRSTRTTVAVAAATALGECASIDAVMPLRETARLHGGKELARAVRQAVAQIQARAGGQASPGRLSLSDAATGQVSLASEAGQLSLPAAEPGQVSLSPDKKG
jgi:HEAT repeat protein